MYFFLLLYPVHVSEIQLYSKTLYHHVLIFDIEKTRVEIKRSIRESSSKTREKLKQLFIQE